jgi:WD40 repeat protein
LINPMAGKTLERRDAVTGKIIADDRLPPRLPQWGELEWLPRFALRVTPDGKGLLFHDRDKGMVLWDLAEGKERLRLPAGFVSNSRSAFTPDGRSLITLGPALQRWDFVPSRPLPSADQGAPGPGTLQRWDLATGRPQYADLASAGHTKPPDKLAFSPDGRRLLSISPDGTARLWDTATSGQVHTWRAHGGARVVAGAFRPDGDRVVTMGNDGYLRLWDAGSGKELRSVTFVDPKSDERPDAKHLLIAPGGKTAMAFAYQDGKYRLTRWNLSTGRTIGSRLLDRMIPSPDGRTAYRIDRQAGDEIRLTDIETGAVTAALKTIGPPGSVPFATHSDGFSDDGRLLAAKVEQAERGKQSGAFVQVWDTAGGPPLANIPAHVLNYINVAFSRDCRLLAFTDADAVRVWDLAAGRELWRRADPARTAVSLAFAPDGRTLAAGCDDTTILLWTLPQPDTGKPIAAGEREVVWTQLASPDAAAAHVAMWRLTDDPKTAVPLLRERLIGTPVAADVVRPLLADLSATEFRTREAAERRLRDLGAGALPDLRSARKAEQRPEAKRRLDALLAPYEGDDHRRRTNRAAAVLQRIGTPDARRVLASLNAPE